MPPRRRRKKVNPEEELRFFFAGHKSVSMTPGSYSSHEPWGLELGIGGWTVKLPDAAYTSDDLREIEAALKCLDAETVSILRQHHSPAPKGQIAGLEEAFDIWCRIVHRTEMARRLCDSRDDTEIRQTIRQVARIAASSKSNENRRNAHTIIRHIRREALTLYIEARNRYEEARKLLREKEKHH